MRLCLSLSPPISLIPPSPSATPLPSPDPHLPFHLHLQLPPSPPIIAYLSHPSISRSATPLPSPDLHLPFHLRSATPLPSPSATPTIAPYHRLSLSSLHLPICNSPSISDLQLPFHLHLQPPPSSPMAYFLDDSEREAKFKKSMRDADLDSIQWHKEKHKINKVLGLSTSETPLSQIPESILFESAISSPNSALGSPMEPDSDETFVGFFPHSPRSENPNSDLGFSDDSEPLRADSDLEFNDGELAFPDSVNMFPESEETFEDPEAAMAFGETALEMESEPPVEADEDEGAPSEAAMVFGETASGMEMESEPPVEADDDEGVPSEAAMAFSEMASGMQSEPRVEHDEYDGVGDEMLRILLPRYFELVRSFLLPQIEFDLRILL